MLQSLRRKRKVTPSNSGSGVARKRFFGNSYLQMAGGGGKFMQKIEAFLDSDPGVINQKLPKELLLRIFSYLDIVALCRCAQVSTYWNSLALDGSNWQRVNLFAFQCGVEGKVVENLSKRCGGFLKELSLKGCENVEDHTLKVFSENCRNLDTLNLYKCKKITDQTLISLGKNSSVLRILDLYSCTKITDQGLRQLRLLNVIAN